MDEDEGRYQVYGYSGEEQIDYGQFDERLLAEARARDAVRRYDCRSAHVMRCRDTKIVYYFDREEDN